MVMVAVLEEDWSSLWIAETADRDLQHFHEGSVFSLCMFAGGNDGEGASHSERVYDTDLKAAIRTSKCGAAL
jgi:hypothetical protein